MTLTAWLANPLARGVQEQFEEAMNMYHDADRALLDPMETASVDALRQHQLERLRWSLKHCRQNVDSSKITSLRCNF